MLYGQQFEDRADAGRRLAAVLSGERIGQPVVLAVPRGGVPVAAEIAAALGAELDLLFVRKIGAPSNREVALGAIAGSGQPQVVLNDDLVGLCGATSAYLDAEAARQRTEIDRQRRRYLGDRLQVPLQGRNVIVVDDGVATGATLAAALKAVRLQAVASITLAVPVGPPETVRLLARSADRVVCLQQPAGFRAVSCHYRDFAQVTDQEVVDLVTRPAAGSP